MITIEDNQLDTELQELYLISKHWISDLEFFTQDLNFFSRWYVKSLTEYENHKEYGNLTDAIQTISEIENHCLAIKTHVVAYLQRLEPLIIKTNQNYQLDLIETQAILESEMSILLQSFKSVKKTIFDIISKDHSTFLS
ncbi:MAG: hypothetical protein H7Y07_06710 [Pyrinomonadaceae bacterium]|nr:hypothetical protein [Sphingobacteriaceae bacterium]